MRKLLLVATCVESDVNELEKLEEASKPVQYSTFARHVDMKALSDAFGYSFGKINRGLKLCDDYAVRFYKSKWFGKPCYYMVHSATECIYQ